MAALRELLHRETKRLLKKYRLLAETMHDVAIFIDADGRIVEANAAAAALYGYSRKELTGLTLDHLCVSGRDCAIRRTVSTGEPRTCECMHRRRDGTGVPVEVSAVRSEIDGRPTVLCVARDLSQRRRRDLLQAIIHEIDAAILRGLPIESILQFICNQLVALNGYALAQISLRAPNGTVLIRTAAGPAATFVEGLEVRWDESPAGHGPTGRAIRTGQLQVSDLETDEGFAMWRQRARDHHLRSAVAVPLTAHGTVLGALTIFAPDLHAFSVAENNELGSFADQIALCILAATVQDQIRIQRVALESAANAVVITDRNGVIEWVNPAFTTLTGFTPQEAVGETPRILRSGNHSGAFYRQMWEQLMAGQVWRGEMYNRRKDGTIYPEEQTITPVRNDAGEVVHFVAIKQDISDRKRQEEQIRFLAMHDPLTSLPNRRAFEATLERTIYQARSGTPAAVLMLDLDEFKLVNDTAGHPAGDQLLLEIAVKLQAQLRPGDFLARLGGDEFVVILQSVDENVAFEVAERLRAAIEQMSFERDGAGYHITVSIGLAAVDADTDARTLVARADAAMYAAKERGKNRVVGYPFGDDYGLVEVSRWIATIRAALRDSRFTLTFQPVIRLGNGTTEHYEALIRMRDENGALILPNQFLPFAERYGLMPQIDRWVIEEVLRTLHARPNVRIFANLSGTSLNDDKLLEHIESCIRKSGVEPGRLAFEITETAAVSDFASARNWIQRLKELGCLFALDDFGVGFSSFGYLRALAVDYVKIDRTFIRDLDTNPTNRALVQAVNTVAHTLGKEVIAEGVESEAHANVLREIGIEHGQGFHWGEPLAALGC